MKITIIEPKSYCAGVTNAINVALKARKENPHLDVYIFGMLVHNHHVVNFLNEHNINTLYRNENNDIDLLNNIAEGSVIVFTAHGHAKYLDDLAKERKLIVYDATCPKVKQNLSIITQEITNCHQVIYIGHKNHPESLAALSISDNVLFYNTDINFDFNKVVDSSPLVINQTTLNTIELENIYSCIKEHIPNARIENEICNTTRLRQEAVKELPNDVDLIIIVGDSNSSNSKRLLEIAKITHPNVESVLLSSLNEINEDILRNKKHVAIGSGASTPMETIIDIVNYLNNY